LKSKESPINLAMSTVGVKMCSSTTAIRLRIQLKRKRLTACSRKLISNLNKELMILLKRFLSLNKIRKINTEDAINRKTNERDSRERIKNI
jgi:hypothetical protein